MGARREVVVRTRRRIVVGFPARDEGLHAVSGYFSPGFFHLPPSNTFPFEVALFNTKYESVEVDCE